jgi:hypothetical protein
LAIEHNSFLIINKKKYSAYQLKQIVMTMPNRHPFINFAFFMPKGGSLKLSDLIFSSIKYLDYDFTMKVRFYLNPKVKIHSDFSLIVLPECLESFTLESILDFLDLPCASNSNNNFIDFQLNKPFFIEYE